jgi:hypothetical protein
MDTDTAIGLAFFAGSIVIAAAMVLVAMTALRDAGGPAPGHEREEAFPAPFAPTPGDDSPLGATDQASTEASARATRSQQPGGPAG